VLLHKSLKELSAVVAALHADSTAQRVVLQGSEPCLGSPLRRMVCSAQLGSLLRKRRISTPWNFHTLLENQIF